MIGSGEVWVNTKGPVQILHVWSGKLLGGEGCRGGKEVTTLEN
jgi:hypothetical protein